VISKSKFSKKNVHTNSITKIQTYFRFPGAKATDDFPRLFNLFLSKDADSSIRSQVAFFGGYDTCSREKTIANKKSKCIENNYVWCEENLGCYEVLNVSTNFMYGFIHLCNRSIIGFQNGADVEAFINLIKSGKNTYFYLN